MGELERRYLEAMLLDYQRTIERIEQKIRGRNRDYWFDAEEVDEMMGTTLGASLAWGGHTAGDLAIFAQKKRDGVENIRIRLTGP